MLPNVAKGSEAGWRNKITVSVSVSAIVSVSVVVTQGMSPVTVTGPIDSGWQLGNVAGTQHIAKSFHAHTHAHAHAYLLKRQGP